MAARPSTAIVSHTTSPTASPAVKAAAPFRPRPSTRATMAAMPGPGEAAATNRVAAKISRAAGSMSASPRSSLRHQRTRHRTTVAPEFGDHLAGFASDADIENAGPLLPVALARLGRQAHAEPGRAQIRDLAVLRDLPLPSRAA